MGAVVALVAAGGCMLPRRSRPQATNVPATAPADDDDRLPWAAEEPTAIVVRKSCRTLDVYRYGQRVASFPVVFGPNNHGSKLFEGDLRTPIGFYAVVDKRPHARWRYFLLLDYPNTQDVHRYWTAMDAGDIPRRGKGYAGMGGSIGIHGTDKPWLNRRNVDWTLGCISLENEAIEEVAALVHLGTPVLIEE